MKQPIEKPQHRPMEFMGKDEIIAWGKEEEAILISNGWNLIGGIRKFNEDNRVSTDVSYLKGIYNASNPQEEETESHVDGVHSAEMKDSGSFHIVISTAVYETADIKNTTLANGIMSEDEIIAWGR